MQYSVCGLIICSNIVLSRLSPLNDVDVSQEQIIFVKTISEEPLETKQTFRINVENLGSFFIMEGRYIFFLQESGIPFDEHRFFIFLLGPCLAAILHQRNEFVLHGSCVTDGSKTILISGISGAGKSTLAAEFLKNGWEMVTDDIAVIKGIEEGHPMVQSSCPSQKLWNDAVERYQISANIQALLYTEENRAKMDVHIEHFHEGLSPLTDIVCLYPTDQECDVIPVTGIAVVNQLMKNTYRPYSIPESQRQQHFQRCVTLSKQIRMHAVLRAKDRDTAPELYEKIIQATEG